MSPTVWLGLVAGLVAIAISYFGRDWRHEPRRLWPWIWLTTGVLTIAYSWIAIWRHAHFETHAFDLGIFDQAIWHASHLAAPGSTVRGIANVFGDHFHPIILLLVPLYWIWSSPLMLLIAQAILLSLIFPLGVAIGRRLSLPTWPVIAIAAVAVLHPGIHFALTFDFHEIAFAPALFLGAILALLYGRWRWYWAAVFGLILTKESVALYAALLGVTLILRARPWHYRTPQLWHGAATVVVGLASFLLITRAIIPALSGGQGYVYLNQYAAVGATPVQVAERLVTNPVGTLKILVDQPDKKRTAKYMLGSFAGLPLLSWTMWPITLLTLGERFWTTNEGLWIFQFHYQLMMIVVYVVASFFLLHDLRRWRRLRGLALGVAIVMVVATAVIQYRLKPLASLANAEIIHRPVATWNSAIKLIPATAAVAAQDAFVPHLAHRAAIYHYPNIQNATWIILDPRAPSWPLTAEEVAQAQQTLRQDPAWRVVYERGTTTVFTKKSTGRVE